MKLANRLESAGLLDKAVESFPGSDEVLSRPEPFLTRPELAVLLAASKMQLTQLLQEHPDLIEADYSEPWLLAYFPEQMRDHFQNDIGNHPLANEIKATEISNQIINQAGCTFLMLHNEMVNTDIIQCTSSYLTFDRVLDGDSLRRAIYLLDNQVDTETQHRMLIQFENTLANLCRWFLQGSETIEPNEETILRYSQYFLEHEQYFQQHENRENVQIFMDRLNDLQLKNVPQTLVQRLALISSLENFPRIVQLATETEQNYTLLQGLFHETEQFLSLIHISEPTRPILVSRMPSSA